MSINWVMVQDGRPVNLPNERFGYISSNRVSFNLDSTGSDGCKIASSGGIIYASLQRLVFIPDEPVTFRVPGKGDKEFRNFAVIMAKLQQPSIVTPWFGPNGWQALVEPIKDGNLEPTTCLWKAKFTFKDGGAFEFAQTVEKLQIEAMNGESLPVYSEI